MRFTYRYVGDSPAAPFVMVRIGLAGGADGVDLPARVDTGADRTVIPPRVPEQLGAVVDRRLRFAGLGGVETELPIYQVQLAIRDLPPVVVDVAASDGEPHVLLGRDVLNRYKLTLDGPAGLLTITDG